MKYMISILMAEMRKSHLNHYHNKLIYFSLLIWPALLFVTAYYSFKPFNLTQSSPLARFIEIEHLSLFLLTGYLGYIFFWCLIQSAWQMSYERMSGTLELIFLTPASRIAVMYGRAAGNLVEAVWLFSLFSLLAVFVIGKSHEIIWWNVPIVMVVLTISAVIWGGFLNVIFLFSRDAGILFTVLEEPMQFFSGVRLPVATFPLWGKGIAYIFPLTYVLSIVRELLMGRVEWFQLIKPLGMLAGILLVLLFFTFLLLSKAENHAKETGNMTLY
ncbi:ABC transporter permease [Bacillus salitolerans]|uniref:Transport permease protein n=1 Tax=Bacillus salitolerans TaxID=1437434 RepID=A0ABW4LQV5_9BACI